MKPGMQAGSVLIAGMLGLAAVATPALAQNAQQCPMSGSPSDWGINSIGYIMLNPGGSCLFSLNVRGEILSSNVAQRPSHGRLQRINRASYIYTSRAGYRGSDTFSVRASGKGPNSSGTSIITVNATLQ